jgi:hypothetical protein
VQHCSANLNEGQTKPSSQVNYCFCSTVGLYRFAHAVPPPLTTIDYHFDPFSWLFLCVPSNSFFVTVFVCFPVRFHRAFWEIDVTLLFSLTSRRVMYRHMAWLSIASSWTSLCRQVPPIVCAIRTLVERILISAARRRCDCLKDLGSLQKENDLQPQISCSDVAACLQKKQGSLAGGLNKFLDSSRRMS